jgi:hypothetical protein
MRITEEQLAAERERMELEHAGKWFPTRWWRAVGAEVPDPHIHGAH